MNPGNKIERRTARNLEHLESVVRLMRADRSLTLTDAVRMLNDAPSYSAFKEWLRLHPIHKARIVALRSAPASEIYFDEIAALIRKGMTIKEACRAKPEYPSDNTFQAWLHRKPQYAELKPLIDANNRANIRQRKPRLGFRKYDSAELDRALAVIRSSDAADLRDALVPPLPPMSALDRYARKDADFARRLSEAKAARPNPNIVTDGDIERALSAIQSVLDQRLSHALRPANGLPAYVTVQKRAEQNQVLAERLRAALAERESRRPVRLLRWRSVRVDDNHRRSLYANETFRAARRLMPRRLSPSMKEDVLSDIVVALLDGVAPQDVVVRRLVSLHRKRVASEPLSIDDEIAGVAGLHYGDRLTSTTEVVAW